ncbi:MAG TPA: hypothetical protein VF189_02975 [Patescibacteria group bacterium]
MNVKYLPWKRIFIFCLEIFFGINIVLLDLWIYSQSHLPQNPPNQITPTPTIASISQIPTPTPLIIEKTNVVVQNNSSVKEIFVPLGSGQSNLTDWTDIPGALAYLDSTAYKGIKKVVLEATVTIPNGNETAWIRLFNKTDGHPVWFSETSWSGGDTQFVISQPINFDSGNKLYQVQIKNQLPTETILSNSRIHITLN